MKPIKLSAPAKGLSRKSWKTVRWRQGSANDLTGRFAAKRIFLSHRDYWRMVPWLEEWLVIDWPEGEDAATKYWLSTLPPDTPIAKLVDTARLH